MDIGQAVTYIDRNGLEHDALVTEVWTENCVNLVYVMERDMLIRLETETSVTRSNTERGTWGFYE